MSIIKGKGQRLIPEELLKYLEKQNKKYPNPESLGTEVTANVEPVGGESNLTSIKIGDTVYLIPSNETPLLEDIEDSAGNKRFVEGDGTPKTISGVTSTYCKWSLSGSHLMIVFAGSINTSTTISGTRLAEYTIPSFIYNKIYPTFGDVIEIKTLNAYPESGATPQGGAVWFYKKNDIIYLYYNDSTTFTGSIRYFRLQFDLLIDADYSE